MAQVSKYPISKEVADRIFDVLIKGLIRISNVREAQELTNDLFTPVEKIMLAKRLSIAFLLLKGYQYREISQLLKVSVGTISSVNSSLKYGSGGYKKILYRINKEEQLETFFEGMVNKLVIVASKGSKGSGTWKYLKQELQKSQTKKNRQF